MALCVCCAYSREKACRYLLNAVFTAVHHVTFQIHLRAESILMLKGILL